MLYSSGQLVTWHHFDALCEREYDGRLREFNIHGQRVLDNTYAFSQVET